MDWVSVLFAISIAGCCSGLAYMGGYSKGMSVGMDVKNIVQNQTNEGIIMGDEFTFRHQCIGPKCKNMVEYDDEPWCFSCSPDAGSSVAGYSARARLTEGVPISENLDQ